MPEIEELQGRIADAKIGPQLHSGRKENLTHVATVIRWPILPMF